MGAWYEGATIKVEAAFGDDPLEPNPSWTDISDYAVSYSLNRGRESQFTTYSAGTCTLILENHDRRFDPDHSAGPHYGDLVPEVRIRISVDYDGIVYPRFDGFVQGWPTRLSGLQPLLSYATIQLIDLTAHLENATLQRSSYEAVVMADSPIHYWPLQEQNSTPSAQYDDLLGGGTLLWGQSLASDFPAEMPTAPAPTELAAPIGATTGVDVGSWRDGTGGSWAATLTRPAQMTTDAFGIEFWTELTPTSPPGPNAGARVVVESPVQSGQHTYLTLALSITGSGQVVTVGFSSVDLNLRTSTATVAGLAPVTGLAHWAVWVDGTNITAYRNGAEVLSEALTSGAIGTGSAVPPGVIVLGTSISHVAVYADGTEPDWHAHYLAGLTAFGHPFGERGGARIERVLDEIGLPDEFRDIATGDTVHGPYVPNRQSALAYLRAVETAENGMVFVSADGKVTFRGRQWRWVGSARHFITDDQGEIITDDDDNPLFVVWVPTSDDQGNNPAFREIKIDAGTLDAQRNSVSVTFQPDSSGYVEVNDGNRRVRRLALSTPTINRASTARGLAAWLLGLLKDPQTQVSEIVIYPTDSDPSVSFPALLALELGDRLKTAVTPVEVGSAVMFEGFVDGISEEVDGQGVWRTSLYLSPAEPSSEDAGWFTVGDEVLGVTGATASNKIQF